MPAMGALNNANITAATVLPQPPTLTNGDGGASLNVTAVNATNAPHQAVRVIPVSGLPLIVTAKNEPKQKPLFHCPIDSKDHCSESIAPKEGKDENLIQSILPEPVEKQDQANFTLERCDPENENQLQIVMLTNDRFNMENRQTQRPLSPTEYLIGCTSKMPLLGNRTAYKVEPQFRRVGRNKFINYMRKRSIEALKKRDNVVEEILEIPFSPRPAQYANHHQQSEEERLNLLDIESPFKRYIGNAPDQNQHWGVRCAELGDVDNLACSPEQLHRNKQFMKVNKPAFNQERRKELDSHLLKRKAISDNGTVFTNLKKRSTTSDHIEAIKMFKRQQELKEEEAKMDFVRRWASGDLRPRSFEPLKGPLLLQRDFDDDDEDDQPALIRRHLDEDNVWEARSLGSRNKHNFRQGGVINTQARPVHQKRSFFEDGDQNLQTRSPGHFHPPGGAGFNLGPRPMMVKRDVSKEDKLETRSLGSHHGRLAGGAGRTNAVSGGLAGGAGAGVGATGRPPNRIAKRAVLEDDVDVDFDKRSKGSHGGKWDNGWGDGNRYAKRELQDDLDDELEKRSKGSHGGRWSNGWGYGNRYAKRESLENPIVSKLTRRAVSENGKDKVTVHWQKRNFSNDEDGRLETRSIGTSHRGGGGGMAGGRGGGIAAAAPAVNAAAAAPAAAQPNAGMKRSFEENAEDLLETRSIGTSHRGGGGGGMAGGRAGGVTAAAAPVANAATAAPAAARPNAGMKRSFEENGEDNVLETRSIDAKHRGSGNSAGKPATGQKFDLSTIPATVQKRSLDDHGDDLLETRSLGTTHRGGGAAGGRVNVAPAAVAAGNTAPAPAAATRPAVVKRDGMFDAFANDERFEKRSMSSRGGGGRGYNAGRGWKKRDLKEPNIDLKRRAMKTHDREGWEKRSRGSSYGYRGKWWKRSHVDDDQDFALQKREAGTFEDKVDDAWERRSWSSRGNGGRWRARWRNREVADALNDHPLVKREITDFDDQKNDAWEKRSWKKDRNYRGRWRHKRENAENINDQPLVKRAISENGKDDLISGLQKRDQHWAGGGTTHWAGQWGAGGGGAGGGGEGMRKRDVLSPEDLHIKKDQIRDLLLEHGAVHDILAFEHNLEREKEVAGRGPSSWNGNHGPGSLGPRRGWRRWHHRFGPHSRERGLLLSTPPPPPPHAERDLNRRQLPYDDDDAMTVRSLLSAHGDIFPRGVKDFEKPEEQIVQKRDTTTDSKVPIVQKRDTQAKPDFPPVQKRDTIASAAWNWAMKKLQK